MLLSFLKKSSSAKFYWFAILLCVSASLSSEKCSAARYPCCETTAGSFSVTKLIGSLMMCKSTVWSLIFSKLNFHNPSLPILQFNTKKLKETSHSLSIFFFLLSFFCQAHRSIKCLSQPLQICSKENIIEELWK